MIYLLYVASGYLLVISLILLQNRKNFTTLKPAEDLRFAGRPPKVSICIPARNEEDTIERSVLSAIEQDYSNLQVLVLNDRSEDATGDILARLNRRHPDRLTVVNGAPLPEEWMGKPWACHQLSEAADGDIIIFADADTWFENDTATRVVRTMNIDSIELLTVWPQQELGSFWEKMLIPLVYQTLLTLLPSHYVYRSPQWMPAVLRRRFAPWFAAACGQFMAFSKEAYRRIGGHRAVKNRIVEDVALARLVKRHEYKMRMYHGGRAVSCRMYRSEPEIREGFRKNFLAGFGYNITLFVLMGLVHIIAYLMPVVGLVAGLLQSDPALVTWSSIPVGLMIFDRMLLARWFGWNPLYAFLHPAGVIWFQYLGILVLIDYGSGNRPRWKGRRL